MSVLGGVVYINRKGFSDFIDPMNHNQEDEFNKRLDELIETNNRAELAKYSFVSFTKPADFEPKKYAVEPMGWEHEEMREADEEFKVLTARDRAKHHFRIMWLCGHSDELEELQRQVTLSTEELGKLRGIGDPKWVENLRAGIARTIRQVEWTKQKYSLEEIAEANAFREKLDSRRPREEATREAQEQIDERWLFADIAIWPKSREESEKVIQYVRDHLNDPYASVAKTFGWRLKNVIHLVKLCPELFDGQNLYDESLVDDASRQDLPAPRPAQSKKKEVADGK